MQDLQTKALQEPAPPIKKRYKRLTPQETKLVQLKAKGATHNKAYRAAYNVAPTTKNITAAVNTNKILKRPHVKNALEQAMKKYNLSIDRAIAPLDEALEAVTPEGNTNHTIRLQASDRVLKLLGIQDNNSGGNFHLHLHEAKNKYNV